jgi:hypothetical protein
MWKEERKYGIESMGRRKFCFNTQPSPEETMWMRKEKQISSMLHM